MTQNMVERVSRTLFKMFRSVPPEGDAWRDYETDAQTIIEATGVVELREALERIAEREQPQGLEYIAAAFFEQQIIARQALTQLAKGSE